MDDEESLAVDTRFRLLVVTVAVLLVLLSATLVDGGGDSVLPDCAGDDDFGGDGGVVGEAVVDIISLCESYECRYIVKK